MRRFKPSHGIILVLLFVGVVLIGELAFEGKLASSQMQQVSPGRDGQVRISLAGLQPLQVRFYQFINAGSQEVHFLVGRDPAGHVAVAFDASEDCAKNKRGFRAEGEWLVCNKCDKAFRLSEVNAGGGGCKPVPLEFREDGNELVIAEADILKGWRLFH